jgi:hypothetical protein
VYAVLVLRLICRDLRSESLNRSPYVFTVELLSTPSVLCVLKPTLLRAFHIQLLLERSEMSSKPQLMLTTVEKEALTSSGSRRETQAIARLCLVCLELHGEGPP